MAKLVQLTFKELAEAVTKQANYNCLESAPAGLRPPLMGLGFEFDLDELRDVVISASHHTAEQEIVDDVCGYPIELYAAVLWWAGSAKTNYDLEQDFVILSSG